MAILVEIVAFFAVGVFFGWVSSALFVWMVRREAQTIHNTKAGAAGRQAQQEYSERLLQAMAEASAMFKDKVPPKDIMVHVVTKYPDVAMKSGKKLQKIVSELQGGD